MKTTMLALVVMGCTAADLPEKVFDFAPRPLTGDAPALVVGQSPKMKLRAALDALQPRLAQCVGERRGELGIVVRVVVDPSGGALESIATTFADDPEVAACARGVLGAIDVSGIAGDPAVWVVHAPYTRS